MYIQGSRDDRPDAVTLISTIYYRYGGSACSSSSSLYEAPNSQTPKAERERPLSALTHRDRSRPSSAVPCRTHAPVRRGYLCAGCLTYLVTCLAVKRAGSAAVRHSGSCALACSASDNDDLCMSVRSLTHSLSTQSTILSGARRATVPATRRQYTHTGSEASHLATIHSIRISMVPGWARPRLANEPYIIT